MTEPSLCWAHCWHVEILSHVAGAASCAKWRVCFPRPGVLGLRIHICCSLRLCMGAAGKSACDQRGCPAHRPSSRGGPSEMCAQPLPLPFHIMHTSSERPSYTLGGCISKPVKAVDTSCCIHPEGLGPHSERALCSCRAAAARCSACGRCAGVRSARDGGARPAAAEVAGLCRGCRALQQPGLAPAGGPGHRVAGGLAWHQ